MIRKLACGTLAVGLIATGSARRARRRALREDVITAIYFHKPQQKLFLRCVRWLIKHGYVFVSAADVARYLRGDPAPRGAVWLSFDDGCRELLKNVLPVVRDYNIPVTLFVCSGIVQGDGLFPWLAGERRRLPSKSEIQRESITLDELLDLKTWPQVTIGAHTVNHVRTDLCTEHQLRSELGECRRALETITGMPVDTFAYPNGCFDGCERLSLAEFRYQFAATTENSLITREADPYLVPRFSVADAISFPEAVCNMVGIWRPVVDSLKKAARYLAGTAPRKTPGEPQLAAGDRASAPNIRS